MWCCMWCAACGSVQSLASAAHLWAGSAGALTASQSGLAWALRAGWCLAGWGPGSLARQQSSCACRLHQVRARQLHAWCLFDIACNVMCADIVAVCHAAQCMGASRLSGVRLQMSDAAGMSATTCVRVGADPAHASACLAPSCTNSCCRLIRWLCRTQRLVQGHEPLQVSPLLCCCCSSSQHCSSCSQQQRLLHGRHHGRW